MDKKWTNPGYSNHVWKLYSAIIFYAECRYGHQQQQQQQQQQHQQPQQQLLQWLSLFIHCSPFESVAHWYAKPHRLWVPSIHFSRLFAFAFTTTSATTTTTTTKSSVVWKTDTSSTKRSVDEAIDVFFNSLVYFPDARWTTLDFRYLSVPIRALCSATSLPFTCRASAS